MNVAYVRHIGPYQGDSKLFGGLINKLMTGAGLSTAHWISIPEL